MSSNFIQWNPAAGNQESDASYAGDSQRAGGASNPSLFDATLANKLFFQLSTFLTAFAQSLVNKGYSPVDGSDDPPNAVLNLAAVLANILTNADIPDLAAAFATFSFSGTAGYIKFPLFGGFTIQWIKGPSNLATGEINFTVNWPIAFANACLSAQATMLVPTLVGNAADAFYQVISYSTTSANLFLQQVPGGTRNVPTNALLIGIGF